MNSWKHSGFSVYCAQPIEACDDNGRKTLSEYISRAPFSLERMSFNENSKTVVYKGEHFHPTLARNIDVAGPLEWIAHITAHIPKKGAKQVIYYGAYSQAWCGRERRQGILGPSWSQTRSVSSCFRWRTSYTGTPRLAYATLVRLPTTPPGLWLTRHTIPSNFGASDPEICHIRSQVFHMTSYM